MAGMENDGQQQAAECSGKQAMAAIIRRLKMEAVTAAVEGAR